MLAAILKDQKVYAFDVERNQGLFHCIGCGGELVLKKGQKRVHHFAHKPPSTCDYGAGESEIHARGKQTVYEVLKGHGHYLELEIEKNIGPVVLDVFAKYEGLSVAFEIQKSALSLDDIARRTNIYTEKGIHVLWLVPYTSKLEEERYSPKVWEKWLHGLYFGRIYYLLNNSDGEILPVHFGQYDLYVESSSWYSEYGEELCGGGYSYPSKRFRTPMKARKVALLKDFERFERKSYQVDGMTIPEALIIKDKLRTWWK